MSYKISRDKYASMYGPTVGDKVRLGDTELFIEVEKDYTTYGEESKFGGGKTLRDGMGQSATVTNANGALDLVLTNAIILDYWGIVKADIGIKDGKIVAIGKSGNPDVSDNVSYNMVIGAGTEVLSAEGKIVTAGGIDTHVHWICPQAFECGFESGLTTMLGGGTGPVDGTNATTCTPGPWNLQMLLKAADDIPVNIGFYGKGNSSTQEPLIEQIMAGACGLKLHEDWGTTPQVIDTCLKVADNHDVQVFIHTDTLNEAGNIEDTLCAIDGRVMHTFHTEGAGGGHAPDIIAASGYWNVLPGSTNPTMPYTINTIDEHMDMLMVCHHLDSKIPEDVAFSDSRIRPETIAAEDVLHDMGIFSIMSSDSQAMGRVGEVITRTWQCAHKMKIQRGPLPGDGDGNDNARAKRYIAKYTINPSVANGIADYVGSVEVGKYADLVVWEPKFFGSRPEQMIKGGITSNAKMGEANASIPTPQPVFYKNMFGAFGHAVHDTAFTFVSKASMESGNIDKLGLRKKLLPVGHTRTISKKDMKNNDVVAEIKVDHETYEVFVNGEQVTSEPATNLPLTQRYNLF